MSEPVTRHLTVPRTARYLTLGDAAAAHETWVALHGYGQLATYFARNFESVADGRHVIVPEALSRFYLEPTATRAERRVGATWMTREDRAHDIADYVRWLDLAIDDAAPLAPLCVLGFSQGTATACRWLHHRAMAGRSPARRLVLWAGEVPPDLPLGDAWLARTRVTLVHAADDPLAPPARVAETRARLDAAGVAYDAVSYVGGHRIPPDALARVLGGRVPNDDP